MFANAPFMDLSSGRISVVAGHTVGATPVEIAHCDRILVSGRSYGSMPITRTGQGFYSFDGYEAGFLLLEGAKFLDSAITGIRSQERVQTMKDQRLVIAAMLRQFGGSVAIHASELKSVDTDTLTVWRQEDVFFMKLEEK